VSPPIVRGRQLAKQRLMGVVFLVALALGVSATIALYEKAFTSAVTVRLEADRVGNQLTPGADVKVRGVLVGEVRSVKATATGAELRLRLKPDAAGRVPAGTTAMILPKTLFGEKFVALVYPGTDAPAGSGLHDGSVIAQDRSSTARETSAALDDLLPLLQTLKPDVLSTTLNAVSSAVRDRGDRIGKNLQLTRDYLTQFNPELPTLAQDMAGTADLADDVNTAEPAIKTALDNFSVISQNLVAEQTALDALLRNTTGVAGTLRTFTSDNATRFITLARESVPNLQVYARYSPQFPCMAHGLAQAEPDIARAFGTLQPGLHITLEITKDNQGYVPGDEPEYLDDGGPTCRGLYQHEVPFPEYRDANDGYRDGQAVDPATGVSQGSPPSGPSGPYTYPDQRRQGSGGGGTSATNGSATPFSPASYDRAAVGEAVAPALGLSADSVPDVAVLLFAPLARGTVVSVS
jgi:virulence factor Mce-like protein